jgi:hypothetical protein
LPQFAYFASVYCGLPISVTFVFFNDCRGLPIFAEFLPMFPKRCFLDPRRFFADADVINTAKVVFF